MFVVRLRPHEGPRLKAIRLRSLQDAPHAFSSTYEESAQRSDAVWDTQVREIATLVAVHEMTDVGIVRGVPDTRDPTTAFLISMWVAPEMRGKGVADALVDGIVAWARVEGFRRIVLDVGDANAPAVALYERTGFVRIDEATEPSGSVPEHRRALQLHSD